MKIKRISLSNFRWHRELEINNIAKHLIITGMNGTGKSSVLNGLTWNLAGVTKHTSATGAGSDVLVLDGEGRAVADVTIEKDGTDHIIKRSIPHNLEVDGAAGGIKRTTELLNAIISPLTQKMLLLSMEGRRILSMSDQERKKFLAEAVGISGRVDTQVRADLTGWLRTQTVTDEETTRIMDLFDDADEKSYHHFFGLRRDNNIVINTLVSISSDVPVESVEEIDASLDSFHKRRVMLELELKLAEARNPDGDRNVAAIVKKPNVDAIQSKLENLRMIFLTQEKDMMMKQERLALCDSQITQVCSATKQCPVFCKECPLPESDITSAIVSLNDDRKRQVREFNALNKRTEASKNVLAEVEEELEEAKEEIRNYCDVWNISDTHSFERIRPPQEIKTDIDRATEEIKQLGEKKMTVTVARSNAESNARLLVAKQNEIPLEVLVRAFSPAGITSLLLTSYMRRLETVATEASAAITHGRYQITFSISHGELDVSVVSSGRKRPINTLSSSEEVWVSFIIQHVINQFTGNRLLILDDADILDNDMRNGLQAFLLSECEEYDTIIICATNRGEVFLPGLDTNTTRIGV